jgi:hypothetical protein
MGHNVPVTSDEDRLVCIYELPLSLLISKETLDHKYQIQLAARDALLHLPSLNPDSEDLVPPVVSGIPEPAVDLRSGREAWGTLLTGEPFTNDGVLLYAIAITIECANDEAQSVAEDLPDILTDWFKRFRAWIRVLVNQPLRPTRPIHNRGHGLAVFRDAGAQAMEPMRFSQVIRVVRRERETLSHNLWTVALKAVSTMELPPPAHIFVADAREALDAGDPRRAVLDAATGAELALAHLLDSALDGLDPDIRRALTGERRTLGTLITTIANAGRLPQGVTRGALSTGLTQVRNMAIHKGRPPSRDQAHNAVEVGAEVVRAVFPLL